MRGVEITIANVHDTAELDAILADAPEDAYADVPYSGSRPQAAVRAREGAPCIVHTGTWSGAEALVRLRAHNAAVGQMRGRIDKVFARCKRSYGLRRMRWLGLSKAGLQARLTVTDYNLRRSTQDH